MSSVTVDDDTATDGQAADTEDEIQRQTNKIRREIEKERKQKVKVKHPAPSPVKMHPDVQILANSNTGSDSISRYGMSPTMAAIAAANHSYHQALYTPSLSSCASTSTPNLASAALYESPPDTYNQRHHQMAPLSPEQYYQQIAAALHNEHHMSPKVGYKLFAYSSNILQMFRKPIVNF